MEKQSQTPMARQTLLLFYCISKVIHFEQSTWSIWLECSAGSETSIPITQSLSLSQSIPCSTPIFMAYLRPPAGGVNGCCVALFVLCSQERLLALKRSMSFMQDMDFSQQAAILGDDDITPEEPVTEITPIHTEYPKKSKKQPIKEPIIR